MLALMLLQGAPLLAPLHLSDAPPPTRCAQHILLKPDPVEGEEARAAEWVRVEAEARAIVGRLEAGADFAAEAAAHSDAPDARSGACLGSLPQGVLNPAFEAFLWRAKPWERSAPIATDGALHILRRVPERVGVRLIVVPREERARAAEVALALLRGEDFAELASRFNDDPLLKSRAALLGIAADAIDKSDLHVHVPAGATPKDGPSAGVAMFSALASLFTDRALRSDTAMTGEVSLRGLVMPVGGIRDKVLAAMRAGVKRVLLPARNRRDLEDIPAEALRSKERKTIIPPLHGALLKNEQDVHLFERLIFMARHNR